MATPSQRADKLLAKLFKTEPAQQPQETEQKTVFRRGLGNRMGQHRRMRKELRRYRP